METRSGDLQIRSGRYRCPRHPTSTVHKCENHSEPIRWCIVCKPGGCSLCRGQRTDVKAAPGRTRVIRFTQAQMIDFVDAQMHDVNMKCPRCRSGKITRKTEEEKDYRGYLVRTVDTGLWHCVTCQRIVVFPA
jgi:hypothetical protein